MHNINDRSELYQLNGLVPEGAEQLDAIVRPSS